MKVGTLTTEWSERYELSSDVAVGVGGFDCHFVQSVARLPLMYLARAIGASIRDIMVASYDQIGDKLKCFEILK